MPTFPVQPEFGSGGRRARPHLLEEYDDGTYREYKRGFTATQHRTLQWSELSLAETQAIDALVDSCLTPGNSSVFTFSDFLDGSSHSAIFLDDFIEWTMDGPCTFGASVRIRLTS